MDKKKKFNTNRVAAYALSGVMLASVIPYNVFATEDQAQNALNNAAAASEPGLEVSPSEAPSQVRDAAAPEDTSTSADAKNAVHGFVGVLVGGDINADLKAETGQRFKPIEGVRVYFQWYEKKGNRTSPTYSAVSGADGQFHMGIKPYIGRDGKLVKFDADTTVSAGDESYKMWVDESTIPEGYQLQYSTGEGVEFTDRKVAGGDYQLGPNRLVNYRVLLMEKQDEAKMHKGATQTTPQISKTGQGAVWGKVSWDYESAGGVQWGIVSTPTSPAGGVTVTASYLSDYALKQIYSANTAKMLGLSKPSDIRGSGWTFKLETQLQEWIAEQVAADKEKWIAETVSAKTNAEGDYLIQFKGTWGPHRNTSAVAEYERVAGKYYAGDAHKWSAEEANRLGTVAENAKDGSFLTGALDWNEKHVNSDWLFISTKDTDDVVKRTPWNYNWYTGSDNGWGIHGGWAQVAFGVSTVQAANSTRADFNLAPAEIKFNITNFDTQANTAIPGDVATTKTAGLPYKNTNDSFKIVWYDQDGKIVKEQKEAEKPTSTGALAESTFDTKDVKETKTFIAKLHYVKPGGGLGPVLAQDAFTVKVGKIVVSAYDDVNIANPGAKENEGATYKAEGLPEGLTIDKNTGTVSGKAKVPGKYTVTVTTSILDEDSGEIMEGTSNYTALVTDSPLEHGEVGLEYNKTVKPAEVEGYVFKEVSAKFIDGKVIEGLTITGDKISGTPKAEVAATQEGPNVEVTYDIYKLNSKGDAVLIKEGHKDLVPLEITKAASQAPKYEPAYTDVEGTPGAEAIVAAPKLLDQKSEADPKPEVTKPSNVKFALGDGAPEGATIDANTGAVTYTPTARDANTTVNIPVKVTYSDGTIDETLAKIKVGQAQADSYQPEYTEAEGKAGTEATVSAPNFKDAKGQATTKPEGVEFTIGKDAPTGATVDKTTGEVKYTPSIDDAGTVVNIPVIVIYKDGSADEVKAPIKVAQGDNLNYEPDYKSVVAQVAHEVTVASPDFLDTDGNKVAQKPAVAKYELGEGAKSGVTIDETTGEIKYTAVDADKDTVIEVPVVVTYADGSKESVTAKIDVPSDANFYDPKPFKLTTEQGTVPAAKDGVKFEFTPPADTKYEWQAVPKVNEAGETTGIVKISYPDGTEDLVEVPVTVKASASKKTTVDDTNKKPVDPTDQKQRTGIVVTNLDEKTTVSAKDANHKDVTPVINKVTGEIEVTPGTDATGPITVTVTDSDLPEGKRDIEVPVAEKSEKPGITAPTAGDQTISGTGTPGARVNLALKRVEDIPIANDVAVKDDGTWTADVPAGILLKENDTVVATQKEDGKSVSDPVEAKVGAKTPEVDKSALQAEVDKEDTTKADVKYTNATDEKKTAYDEALTKAKEVLTNENATQEDVNKATEDLKAAEAALDGKEAVDKAPLQAEVDKEDTTKADVKYTNATDEKKTAYDEALTKAKEVLADENATQEDVNKATEALKAAEAALDGKEAVDKAPLQAEVDKEDTTKADVKYTNATDEKKTAYDEALTKAKEVLADENATQEDVNKATEALKAAEAALDGKESVDKKPLQDEVGKKDATQATDKYKNADQDKKDAYDKALEEAQKVLDNKDATQEEVNKAKDALKAAEEALNGTATQEVDKSALQTEVDKNKDAAITGSDKYKNADQDKKDAYDKALADAKKVLENKDATQEEVNKAKDALKAAEEALNGEATVDKTGLQKEADKETSTKESDKYKNADTDKKKAYDDALAKAKEVLANDKATQEEVNAAKKALKDAEDALDISAAVDKAALKAEVDKKDATQATDKYKNADQDKKDAYDKALADANKVLENKDATQEEVNKAKKALEEAEKSLNGKPSDNTGGTVTPGKPSDNDNTGGNDGYRPGHGGSDVFDRLFRRHDYTPTYPVKTVVPEKTEYGTPVRDTLWYVFHINEFEYEVVRNGVVTKKLMDVTPVIQNGRTMLPLRYVAEALQADVTWDAKTRTATFTKDGLTASIQIDSDEIVLSNGKTVKMDSKPLNINDRILVSVTNVANVFGLTNGNTKDNADQDIEWEQKDKSATIYIRR